MIARAIIRKFPRILKRKHTKEVGLPEFWCSFGKITAVVRKMIVDSWRMEIKMAGLKFR